MSFATILLLSSARLVVASFPDCVNGPLKSNTVCNTAASAHDRATALVALFTMAEKISNSEDASPGVSRLGLPAYEWWNEALHGVANSPGVKFAGSGDFNSATSFPQPILMGAAFDDALIQKVANVVSTEARAFNNANRAGLDFWTPNINPYRDPRWGRGQETPGEDPFHLSSYVYNLIIGLQGGLDPQYKKVVATCKHFAGYDMEDWMGVDRRNFNAIISSQDLVEYYMPSFRTCARDANVGAFMCSFNAVNGVPSCANQYLLNDILRGHWGWTKEDQWVTSDCDANSDIYLSQHYVSSPEQAVADALNAGVDVDCGFKGYGGSDAYSATYLQSAFNKGLVNQSTLDRSLVRQYASLVKLGYFDPAAKQPYRSLAWSDVNTASAKNLAYLAAVEGIVMLKNDGTLPLSQSKVKTIALIGPWAQATGQMQGNYAGNAPFLNSPQYAAQQLGFKVNFAQGTGINSTDQSGFSNAVSIAKSADVIIYCGGTDNSIEAEDKDRTVITWPGNQLTLLNQLAGVGKPLVILQMGGPQIDSSSLLSNSKVNAILWGGYPGQSGGTALFDILVGKKAPAGRLPVTNYPAHYVTDVAMTNMALRPSSTSPGRTYKWYTGTPVVQYGFGLHYTTFTASIVSPPATTYDIATLVSNCASAAHLDLCPFQSIQISVSNTGSTASDFVALMFLTGTFGPSPYPKKSLVAYTRLLGIQPSKSSSATLPLTLGSLSRVDAYGNTVLYPGSFTVVLDIDAKAKFSFNLTGSSVQLDAWPQPH